jgi:hypothetical protein
MVIDLPSSSQTAPRGNLNPVTQTLNQRLDTLQAALKALNIPAGVTLNALVKAIHPVDDALRARLIQQATPPSEGAKTGANRNATAPEAPAASAKNIDPQTLKLLNAADLKMAKIEVQGKSVLVFTDRALRPNQTLTVQLHNQRLQIVSDTPMASARPTNMAAMANAASASSYKTFLSAEMPPPTSSSAAMMALPPNMAGQPRSIAPLTTLQLNTLQQALRTQLPLQADPQLRASTAISDTLLLAQLLTQLLRQPGSESLAQQIPRSVQESLQQLASHLRSHQQLADPQLLRQAIRGSGVQLESQLSQPLTSGQPPLPQTNLKAALLHTLNQLKTAAQPNQTVPAQPSLQSQSQVPAHLQRSSTIAQGATAGGIPTSALPLISALQQLVQGQSLQRKNAAQQLSAHKLLQATQQQVQQAVSKILYLQLLSLQQQSLQHTRPHQEGLSALHLQLEIPLNVGLGAQVMSLTIDEDWVTDYSKDDTERREKVQQWQVKLAFELPHAGTLHAHLTVIQQQLSASLWAEDPITFNKTRASLVSLKQQLEKDGCVVKQLECFQGRPPAAEPVRLHYSLIDVQT